MLHRPPYHCRTQAGQRQPAGPGRGGSERPHTGADESDSELAQAVHDGHGLAYLQDTARRRENAFAALVEAVKANSLGQISHALYDVGGEYRRNM